MNYLTQSYKRPRGALKAKIGNGAIVLGATSSLVSAFVGVGVGYVLAGILLLLVGLLLRYTRVTTTAGVALLVAGCALSQAGKPSWFSKSEQTKNSIAQAAETDVPYPLSTVKQGGFLERRNQVEKIKRFSDKDHNGFVYIMSFGKFIGYYAIKGKVSSVNSQLTNEEQTWDCGSDCSIAVNSIGDDGTWGPDAGGDQGVFFFTTAGTMVVTDSEFLYADKPLPVENVPQLER